MSLLLGGVLDDFPRLRFAFLESGAGWAPYWMDRLDDYYEEFKEHRLEHLPSDYFRSGQCFISCEVEEKTIPYVVQVLGEDRVIYASDYLHHDAKFPRSVALIAERKDLSRSAKTKILGGNAAKLFRLNG
ncbi:MAG: amidohydrolase family protein [Chloroflexi bacterium]|nr:amidohydrolase family protein [Chloroflexota bacterium]